MSASPRYLELLQQMADLHVRKSADYAGADNPDTFANFRHAELFGITALLGCMIRLSDKYVRVANLMRNPANEQCAENIKDTLMDLAAYALIAICLLEEQESNDNSR